MGFNAAKLLVLWSLVTIFGPAGAAEVCSGPQLRVSLSRAQAVRVIAKEKGYTEGLLFWHGSLFESLGLYGHSELRKIDPYTGIPTTLKKLDGKIFAEGLAVVSGQLIQLTYKENIALAYSGSDVAGVIPHMGEAWGLTSLNGELVQSNGSAKLAFLDAKTMAVKRSITVHDSEGKLPLLNELETARGLILANVFGQDWVALVNPLNGCMVGRIDLSKLRTAATRDRVDARCDGSECVAEDFATNGIAYDDVKDELYFTGKNWPYIFVFKFPR
jgi:glutaminyl-peptide cyclotransferase